MTDICTYCVSNICDKCMCLECHYKLTCDGQADPYKCLYDETGNERKIKS
jgi:hypothetical protein